MMKSVDLEELITLNYEIEGLLYLALHRGPETPDGVWRLIKEKVAVLNASLPEEDSADTAIPDNNMELVSAVDTTEESIVNDISYDIDDVTPPQEAPAEVRTDLVQAYGSDVVAEDVAQQVVSDVYAVEPKPIENEINVSESQAGEDIIQEFPETENASPISEDSVVNETKSADNDCPEENDDSLIVDEEGSTVVRLDEKLARSNSKNLRKAFSINDKFRFRRELFSNSDTEMTDTLNLVEAMTSYAEAEEYFFSDLQWDPELSEVADFMAIIKNHFS